MPTAWKFKANLLIYVETDKDVIRERKCQLIKCNTTGNRTCHQTDRDIHSLSLSLSPSVSISMADQTQNPQIFELNNGTMLVKITNFGCIITSMPVPDKNGNLADVVLGFDSVEPYLVGTIM
ncbi:uncharacterized protein LOC110650144 isoform X2 [Hevea brasiliensis]|uniref:uncharacterized protein LOC110650144 isoform X2 n=1 Tax=Hevea brasiliensis TaxID=3981 RepID=UPI0025E06FFC|nr:uncharacterized protein LOC110650144 isoform X2 [Hevea brasiliensis]